MDWLYVSIDAPAGRADEVAGFWGGVLGWAVGEPWRGHPEFRSLVPPTGDSYAHVQAVDGSAAVHLDVASEDVGADTDRLVGLGARVVERRPEWTVLASPGGLPFCLVSPDTGRRPAAVSWPDGHRSRLVQVCIDSPQSLHDAEVAFWKAATGWRFEPGGSPEFGGKLFPPTGPVQLLLQRLGDDDAGRSTRAHIDLGTDDRDAEVARLLARGASMIGPGDGWTAMRDPLGTAFCVTDNRPD